MEISRSPLWDSDKLQITHPAFVWELALRDICSPSVLCR